MSDVHGCSIPASTLRWLAAVPADRAVALLLRHSARDALAAGELGYGHRLNEAGVRLAQAFGRALRGRLHTLHSSPLQRCLHTAELLRDAAGAELAVVPDRMLGDPGAYVLDPAQARRNWERLGSEGIMRHMAETGEALPGTLAPELGARALVGHMLAAAAGRPGLHVFVTHDILLAITAARFLGPPAGPAPWPHYLEAAFFWREASTLHAAYRDAHRAAPIGAPIGAPSR